MTSENTGATCTAFTFDGKPGCCDIDNDGNPDGPTIVITFYECE